MNSQFVNVRPKNRIQLIFLFLLCSICLVSPKTDTAFPSPSGPINDFAHVLSPEARGYLASLATALQRETGFSLVIVTLSSLPDNTTIEEYAVKLYAKWGVGAKGKDAGALVLAAINDRRMRIETGYGAEGYLPDAVSARIIGQLMAPAFRQNDFDNGFVLAANEITRRVAAEFKIDPAKLSIQRATPAAKPGAQVRLSPLQVFLIILLAFLAVGTRPGRAILFSFILSALLNGGRGSGRGGGGFGNGFSSGGGFGGFGGGMSGGGGASGRW